MIGTLFALLASFQVKIFEGNPSDAKVWLLLARAVQTRCFRPRKAMVGLEIT